MKQYTGCMIPYKKELEASKMYPISQQIWTILIPHLWVFLRQLRYNNTYFIVNSTEDRFVEELVVEYRWYKPKGRDSLHFLAWPFSWENCRLVLK